MGTRSTVRVLAALLVITSSSQLRAEQQQLSYEAEVRHHLRLWANVLEMYRTDWYSYPELVSIDQAAAWAEENGYWIETHHQGSERRPLPAHLLPRCLPHRHGRWSLRSGPGRTRASLLTSSYPGKLSPERGIRAGGSAVRSEPARWRHAHALEVGQRHPLHLGRGGHHGGRELLRRCSVPAGHDALP